MFRKLVRRCGRPGGVVILAGAVALTLGGCPIDWDAFVTDVVAAGIESASTSFLDALSTYLAGN
jgi:hypothetical protein